jgi:hypothetical protein
MDTGFPQKMRPLRNLAYPFNLIGTRPGTMTSGALDDADAAGAGEDGRPGEANEQPVLDYPRNAGKP